jgi:hypothetical protein
MVDRQAKSRQNGLSNIIRSLQMNKFVLMLALIIMYGCSATEKNLNSTTGKNPQVTNVQTSKSIQIISVLPTKIETDNFQAQFAASALSAATRGISGQYGGVGSLGTMGTTIEGGTIGNSTGLMAPDKITVNGVSITYSVNKEIVTSSQTGKACEFKPGPSILDSTADVTKIRILPNATCP